jgi:DNA helicase-2/ATP-dependent DNA helicase PcrA
LNAPSASRVVICAAGGGKTTRIIKEAVADSASRSLLVTFTLNNRDEIKRKLHEHGVVVPPHIEVMSWFSFLLREMARPYRNALHDRRIDGMLFVEGRSAHFTEESKVAAHYFADKRLIYSDKLAKFVCACDRQAGGAVMARLKLRFDHIYVDEIQDMAGYDLNLLELMLKAGIRLTLVGDHRQATFSTNKALQNHAYAGINIIKKFREWDKDKLLALTYEQFTHRCHQDIASLGDSLFPDEPVTTSVSKTTSDHDGVFIVKQADADDYIAKYAPQILRLDVKTSCQGRPAMNFGPSKGLTFDRVLIFPHVGATKWLATAKLTPIQKSLTKMYVGITRARYSVGFVYDGEVRIPDVQLYRPVPND